MEKIEGEIIGLDWMPADKMPKCISFACGLPSDSTIRREKGSGDSTLSFEVPEVFLAHAQLISRTMRKVPLKVTVEVIERNDLPHEDE